MAQTPGSSCYSLWCGNVSSEVFERCPKCGGRMRPATQVRRLGWLLLVIGALLVIGVAAITFQLAPLMLHPVVPGADGSHFRGTAAQGGSVLGLFGLLILFGLLTVANGAWQIAKGQRSRWLVIAMLASIVLVVAATAWVMHILPG